MFTCEYVQVIVFYLLCGAEWQKLYVILFVTRYSSREEDGMLFGIVCDKGDDVLYHAKCQCLGFRLVLPCLRVVKPDAKKLAFKASNRSFPVNMHCIMFTTCYKIIFATYLFHAAFGMCACISSLLHGKKPCMIIAVTCGNWWWNCWTAKRISGQERSDLVRFVRALHIASSSFQSAA